jgi:hypothetical protein
MIVEPNAAMRALVKFVHNCLGTRFHEHVSGKRVWDTCMDRGKPGDDYEQSWFGRQAEVKQRAKENLKRPACWSGWGDGVAPKSKLSPKSVKPTSKHTKLNVSRHSSGNAGEAKTQRVHKSGDTVVSKLKTQPGFQYRHGNQWEAGHPTPSGRPDAAVEK